jgi:protein TonB
VARTKFTTLAGRLGKRLLTVLGALALTLCFFLVLPLIQAITKAPTADLTLAQADTTELPPPPPPPEEEPEEEPEPEEPPPELEEDVQPLDLSQLELALNPGLSDGMLGGDFGVKLNSLAGSAEETEALFSLSDLDQQPRVVHQPGPVLDARTRKAAAGTSVYVLFIVDERGRVDSPRLQNSTDPQIERAVLNAVNKWKFEPGKRGGKAVRSRMRVPISFPKG